MISIDPAVAGAVASFITLLALIGGGFFWLGKLSNRVGQLETRVDRLGDEVHDLREEMRKQGDDLREEMRDLRNELLEEMRRGNQQLLIALANHSHDADGQPIFRVPVSPE